MCVYLYAYVHMLIRICAYTHMRMCIYSYQYVRIIRVCAVTVYLSGTVLGVEDRADIKQGKQ